jgi:hypothetical protein
MPKVRVINNFTRIQSAVKQNRGPSQNSFAECRLCSQWLQFDVSEPLRSRVLSSSWSGLLPHYGAGQERAGRPGYAGWTTAYLLHIFPHGSSNDPFGRAIFQRNFRLFIMKVFFGPHVGLLMPFNSTMAWIPLQKNVPLSHKRLVNDFTVASNIDGANIWMNKK